MARADRYDPPKTRFLRDVSKHKLEIRLDDGLHRHLIFRRPDKSMFYHFNIVTWPGYLSITGDMDSFTFARTADMFEFFRGKTINPYYWSEKIVAEAKGGHKRFNLALMQRAIRDDFKGWKFKSAAQRTEAWECILADVYDPEENDASFAVREVMDYKCPVTGQRFVDFWDHTFDDYTFHFIWACRAIRWGIEQYDAAKVASEPMAVAA